MKLICRTSWLDDWYVIEFEDGENISDASVEGSWEEMQGLAKAVLERNHEVYKRCAVSTDGKNAQFWSPRNSQGSGDSIPLETADLWAKNILENPPPEKPL